MKFIKLTKHSNKEEQRTDLFINFDKVTCLDWFTRKDCTSYTTVCFNDGAEEDFRNVMETPEQILEMLNL